MGYCVFFFKLKTAYELRISDWSSDVCSADLGVGQERSDRRSRARQHTDEEAGARSPEPGADRAAPLLACHPDRAGLDKPGRGPLPQVPQTEQYLADGEEADGGDDQADTFEPRRNSSSEAKLAAGVLETDQP